ncbi:MAG: trimeric intracellular cation channel family protein [Chthoniobacteraceae bacterium]
MTTLADLLKEQLDQREFILPAAFDLTATFFFAITGALAAMRRHHDYVGLFALAFVAGVGGGLMRDGIFIQTGPPAAVSDGRYILAVLGACVVGSIIGHRIERFRRAIAVLDAVGLGAYAVVGVQKSLSAGLSIPAAILVGIINAAGGGILRDLLVREEPLVFKPGQFYVVAAVIGCVLFVALTVLAGWSAPLAALVAIAVTFLCRIFSIVFKWETSAVRPWFTKPPPEG